MFTHGIRIHSNPLCERIVVSWHIERHAMKKRRRNWRVVRHEARIPCAYKLADGSVVMHPSLYAQLQQGLTMKVGETCGT